MKKVIFKIKRAILLAPNKFGFDLIRSLENYVNEEWSSPIELLYKTNKPLVLVKVPIADIRFMTAHGFKAGKESNAPFITTIREYANDGVKDYSKSTLSQFYSTFQPKSVSEYLYLEKTANNILNNLPASGMAYPWSNLEPLDRIKQRTLEIEFDNKEHKSKIKIDGGDSFYGPVSLEKGELEYKRLINVYNSIKDNGFNVDVKGKNNIAAIVLESNGTYRYFINYGQHRVAALSNLDHEHIILQIEKGLIVRRSEVTFWPGVIKGYFTKSEALKVFDRIFTGRE